MMVKVAIKTLANVMLQRNCGGYGNVDGEDKSCRVDDSNGRDDDGDGNSCGGHGGLGNGIKADG